MDGIYFYSFFWIVWVIATFFMKKTAWRTMVAAVALITIILSSVSLNIGGFQITLSFLFLFFLSCYYAAKQSRRKLVYMAIAVLTVAFAYTSFQLLVFFDPVWIWMDHRWMLAILLVILCFLFYENIQSRLLCLVIGSCQGEMLYSIISQKISFSYIIGSYSFLDTLSLSACCTFIWALVDYIPVYIDGKKPIRGTRQP
ncbi:YphA family membrane protein [Saccharococcus caldoxylosilyticus]|uniref:YphA family membrane protein n=1 Tax=Saccharococcus caldoxylosilyticus TaxID=81408 RepID=UPI001FCC730C|nr:hypothetical protein [Parageobacillus caldoxylosilyticus]BDG36574.1 hypothetical protein PcaKH15_24800 [Parageobacillus caldoxylosilyticus]BDG40362.1 hypothetical protein PcaKH16_25010 [Parageobacillus caldoxylosilyticus]BDG44113.1 hypothetical protein PcaKH35_24580 [Parageobacillus caldoxylosilyticus]